MTLARTTTPGIYRRHARDCARGSRCDCSYVVVHNNRKATFGTLDEAREGKRLAQRQAKLDRAHAQGLHRDAPRDDCAECEREQADREASEPLLRDYARVWIERYRGTGKRGFREETRAEYRSLLNMYALRFFPANARVIDIRPTNVAEFIAWMGKQPSRRGGLLADGTIRRALAPLRSCLASARREGLIEHNPCVDAVLPHRDRIEEDEDRPRPFPGDTMEMVIELVPDRHRVMFEVLAATGMRRSELFGLQVRHLALNGGSPHVKIRQRARRVRGEGLMIGPLKSRHARRDLPISLELADRLRRHISGCGPDDFAFRTLTGGLLGPENVYTKVLAPACAEAGVEWAGYHTFRHTVASRLFAAGRNAKQVQHWLGHHSAAFTLDTYVHLLDDDIGEPLKPLQGKEKARERPETAANELDAALAEIAR